MAENDRPSETQNRTGIGISRSPGAFANFPFRYWPRRHPSQAGTAGTEHPFQWRQRLDSILPGSGARLSLIGMDTVPATSPLRRLGAKALILVSNTRKIRVSGAEILMPSDNGQGLRGGWYGRRGLRLESGSEKRTNQVARQELIAILQEIVTREKDLLVKFRLCEQAFNHPQFPILHGRGLQGNECQIVIEHLARCYAASLNDVGVESVGVWLRRHPGVIYFDNYIVERSAQELERARRVHEFVRGNPGITQYAAREKLDIPQGEMRYLLQYMETMGVISRSPRPRTNRLYPGAIAKLEPINADQDGRSGSDQL
jgi:hypothetical protein